MFDIKAKPQVFESSKKYHQKKFNLPNGFQDLSKNEPQHSVSGMQPNTSSQFIMINSSKSLDELYQILRDGI